MIWALWTFHYETHYVSCILIFVLAYYLNSTNIYLYSCQSYIYTCSSWYIYLVLLFLISYFPFIFLFKTIQDPAHLPAGEADSQFVQDVTGYISRLNHEIDWEMPASCSGTVLALFLTL